MTLRYILLYKMFIDSFSKKDLGSTEPNNVILHGKDAHYIAGGNYGDVYRMEVSIGSSKKIVAVKKNYISGRGDFIGSIREIDFMSRLKHKNIINLISIHSNKEIFPYLTATNIPNTNDKPDTVGITMPLGIRDGSQMMTDKRIKWRSKKKMMLELLLGLEYMHSLNVIHNDIKVNNFIQIKTNNGMVTKWCDFGEAINYTMQEKRDPVGCVTYIYRAPEIAFGLSNYTTKSDIWSFACVIMSILLGKELTLVTIDQKDVSNNVLAKHIITRFPGKITNSDLGYLDPRKKYFKRVPNNNKNINIKTMLNFDSTEFNKSPGSYKQLLDLISHLLVLDPRARYTAKQAIDHPFFDFSRNKITKLRLITSVEPTLTVLKNLKKQKLRYNSSVWFYQFSSCMLKRFYPKRIMFHSLRIYTELLNSKIDINTRLGIRLSLYLATKLFIDPIDIPSFQKMFKNIKISISKLALLEKTEFQLVKYLNGSLYQPTLYETSDKILSNSESLKLFQYEVNCVTATSLKESFQNFKNR